MSRRAFVAGVGMIPFTKPGKSDDYDVMGARAATAALKDAGLEYSKVQQAYVGYVYGDSTSGQRALYNLGETGIPVINVNNNCATGSTALWLARQTVESGAVECALALGFEQMQPGASKAPGLIARVRSAASTRSSSCRRDRHISSAGCAVLRCGGYRIHGEVRHEAETFAKVQVKARKHSADNPYSVFRTQLTEEEVMAAPTLFGPVTRYQACPPTCAPQQRSFAPKSSPAPTDFAQTSRSRRSR